MTDTAIDPKLVERIRKTLNLSRDGGATEHEAAAAADMAAKLMRKHNLTMAQVEAGGGTSGERRTKQGQKGRAQYAFQQHLMAVCAEVNFCVVLAQMEYRRHTKFTTGFQIIGREANVIATQNLFDYLMTTVERLAFEYVGSDNRQRLSRKAVSFKEGAAERLAERLKERHREALVEQAREARQANAIARHPGATPGTALVVSLSDFAQEERDRNEDFRLGRPEGTMAQRRRENDLSSRMFWAALEAVNKLETPDRDTLVEAATAALASFSAKPETVRQVVLQSVNARMASLHEAARLAKETPAQRAKREEREQRNNDRYWKRHWREQDERFNRRDHDAYADGVSAGEDVGLDKQVTKGHSSKGHLHA